VAARHFPRKHYQRLVYLKRGKSGQRRVLQNEEDLIEVLTKQGFVVVDVENDDLKTIIPPWSMRRWSFQSREVTSRIARFRFLATAPSWSCSRRTDLRQITGSGQTALVFGSDSWSDPSVSMDIFLIQSKLSEQLI
jgi:Glycosyltransferase 61